MTSVTVTDPQNSIKVNANGQFSIKGWPVAFTYGHNKAGALLQCNVFGFFIGSDGKRHLVISYTRPHVLDKGKVSKILGRSIAAARLGRFFERYENETTHEEGLDAIEGMKGIRVYKLSDEEIEYTIRHEDNTEEVFSAPEFFHEVIPTFIWDVKVPHMSAARFERVSNTTIAKLFRKIMKNNTI